MVEKQLLLESLFPQDKDVKQTFGLFSAHHHRLQCTSGSVPGYTIWGPEPTHQR